MRPARLHPRDMADRTLRRYHCGLCEQRLDRMKKGALDGKGSYCSAIWPREECHWSKPATWDNPETTE